MTRPQLFGSERNAMVSRRTALRGVAAAGIAATLAARRFTGVGLAQEPGSALLYESPQLSPSVLASQVASPMPDSPDGWRMWYLATADAERPPAPGAPTQEEIDEVVQVQADMTPETSESVKTWGTGLAIAPWSAVVAGLFAEFSIPGGLAQSKVLATLHTAMHDAAVAAWDAQVAHTRPGPAATDANIVPAAGVNPDQPSFPSEHAAVAGAAAAVLSFLIVDAAPGRFDELANAAAESRIAAGAAFRSDVEAGLTLGRSVGELAIAYSEDANDVGEWDPSTMPSGPGIWQPAPPALVETPYQPLAGSRTPWVLESGDQFRSVPPPEYGGAVWKSELETVQHVVANRTFEQERGALWWGTTSPVVLFEKWSLELLNRAGHALPQAAQMLSDLHTAIDDALIAVWDGKYTYWGSRPITEDPELVTVVPTPPYPAYPGGYAAVMGAGSTIVGHYFPASAVDMDQRAWEASNSRLWAGIHYAIDNDASILLGRQVARFCVSRGKPMAGQS